MNISVTAMAALLFTGVQIVNAQPNAANAAQQSKRLVILGASYASDWGTPALPGYEVINAGVAGEDAQEMLARFDRDVLAAAADAVLIWGHINGIHRAPNRNYAGAEENIRASYEAMIELARSNGLAVTLATEVTLVEAMSLTDRLAAFVGGLLGKQSYAARINAHVRSANAWLRDYAEEKAIRLLDFERVLDDGNGFRKREYTQEDGSHVSEAGYAELTRYVRERLLPNAPAN